MQKRVGLLLLLCLAGCHATPAAKTPVAATTQDSASTAQVSTTLFFGLGRADGSRISDADFDAFITREVAARFPDGFTVLRTEGHWREGTKDYAEPSRIVWIIHSASSENNAKIEQLRSLYCSQFKQNSVLRMDQLATKVQF